MSLIPVDEACRRLHDSARLLADREQVSLRDAGGRVLADAITSDLDVPPVDNSAVDGYAVNLATLGERPVTLPVSQRIPAGHAPRPLEPGTAARIFTGAPAPDGADAVLMQEDCTVTGDNVTVPAGDGLRPGHNIRPRGQDLHAGDPVLDRGTRLLPWHVGLLASIGLARVPVYRPLKVAVLSTGNELSEPGDALAPGQIFNSNRYLLTALLERGGYQPVDLGRVADTPAETEAALARAALEADVILSTGGVSVGEEDHVRAAVQALGALDMWRLAIKPGKPFAFGRVADTPFMGLPGNPSAVLVTFLILVKPWLDRCQGVQSRAAVPMYLPADFSIDHPGRRQEYLRVRVRESATGPVLEKHANQSSGMLSSACWADGLAVIPVGESVKAGDSLAWWRFTDLIGE